VWPSNKYRYSIVLVTISRHETSHIRKTIEVIQVNKYYMNFGDFMNSHQKVEDDHYMNSWDSSKNILYLNG
jgi:hypothetical protein